MDIIQGEINSLMAHFSWPDLHTQSFLILQGPLLRDSNCFLHTSYSHVMGRKRLVQYWIGRNPEYKLKDRRRVRDKAWKWLRGKVLQCKQETWVPGTHTSRARALGWGQRFLGGCQSARLENQGPGSVRDLVSRENVGKISKAPIASEQIWHLERHYSLFINSTFHCDFMTWKKMASSLGP